MMYEFIDTNAVQSTVPLPAEAMSFNGIYLENEVDGYRTIFVEGRETISASIDYTEIAVRDGAKYKRRRYLPRTLVVGFQLVVDTPEAFVAAFNKLQAILSQEEAQIIFLDEADKYYIGTKARLRDIPRGRLAVMGEIEITCADPFKYAVNETIVSSQTVGDQKTITVNYAGTYPAHPKIEATCGTDNGFYGFEHSGGAVLQVGDPEEADTEDVQRSEILINDSFANGIPTGWTVNDGSPFNPEADIMTGSWKQVASSNKGNGIGPDSYGTGPAWHGPGLCKAIPADSQGATGAKDFKVTWQWEWFNYARAELSNIQFLVLGQKDGSRYILAGIELMDGTPNSHSSMWRLWVNGEIAQNSSGATNTTSDYDNPWAGVNCAEPSIQKTGSKITFKAAGRTWSFENDAYTDLEAFEIVLYAAADAGYAVSTHMSFFYVNFRKDAIDDEDDLPNSFMPNDVIVVDTSDASIKVNGTESPELGALTNQWEAFVLSPGENTIDCTPSSWVSDDTYVMTYREVFL